MKSNRKGNVREREKELFLHLFVKSSDINSRGRKGWGSMEGEGKEGSERGR